MGDVATRLQDRLLLLGVLKIELVILSRPDVLLTDEAGEEASLAFEDIRKAVIKK